MEKKKITVLIVDDSALVRQVLTAVLSSDPKIDVIGAAKDPFDAREQIKKLNPDVLTLDIEMPKMDGITFLEKIMTLRPMPVVMVSTLTQKGGDLTMRALELGAVDFVSKPTSDVQQSLTELGSELIEKVKIASRANIRPKTRENTSHKPTPTIRDISFSSTEKIIAIGASTGGVEALKRVISVLPADAPGIVVTQHMPGGFTTTFANRLNDLSAMNVTEATDHTRILPGHVYIAPGDRHLELARQGANFVCHLHDGELVSGHKPSVDVLFSSVAKVAKANAVGVILTGMGRDGAAGLKAMRDQNAPTIGQDEKSCVVYGMPKAAYEMGGVAEQANLTEIPNLILQNCSDSGGRRAVRI
jgi:two-component system chemotaxis response regulator CheB